MEHRRSGCTGTRPYAFLLIAGGLLAGCQDPGTDPLEPAFRRGQGNGPKVHVTFSVDAVSDGTCSPTSADSWISRRPGTGKLAVQWDTDAIRVTPVGAGYALTDQAKAWVIKKAGVIEAVGLDIQDIAGPDGIYHSTDPIPLAVPTGPSPDGFTVHLHAPAVPMWRHKGHTGGPRVAMIGTICVDDLVYTPAP